MFPPGLVVMNSEVDLAVESILLKESPGLHSTASPPPAETPEPIIGLVSSNKAKPRPVDFGILDSIQSATIPQDISDEKCPDLMEMEPAFPEQGSLCAPVLEAVVPWRQKDGEDEHLRASAEESLVDNMIREAIYAVALDVHHISKLGLSFLFSDKEEASESELGTRLRSPVKSRKKQEMIGGRPVVEPMKIHGNPMTDIFGQPLANAHKMVRAQECTCPQCGRAMAAARFAPHLEKCMGMGRNSSRLANRRMLQASSDRPSSTGSSNSVRQRPPIGISNQATGGAESDESDEASGDEDYELDDRDVMDDDDDWLAASKRGKTGRKKPSTKKRSKYRNPLLGAPVELGSTKEDSIFHLDDLLDTPPISQQADMGLFAGAHFPGLTTSGTPSPAGSEAIVLRNRKVKKSKIEESFVGGDLSIESFDEDSRDAASGSKGEKSPQVICLDDDEIL